MKILKQNHYYILFASLTLFVLFPPKVSASSVYFAQNNSTGNVFYEYIYLAHNGHSYQGDDSSGHSFGSDFADYIANFANGSDYPIATTSVTSYVTDIILQIKDTNLTENADYAIQFDCIGFDGSYLGAFHSAYVNSSAFSDDFVSVDFPFSGINCDLSKYQIHQIVEYRGGQSVVQTAIRVRAQNTNSLNGYGLSNDNGTIIDDYEPQMVIKSGPLVAKTPVLIVPGTLGTEIDKGADILWPNIDKMFSVSPIHSDDFMDPLAFNQDGSPLNASLSLGQVLTVSVQAFNYSQKLLEDFISQGYATDTNLSLFPYDWRDDIAKNANTVLSQKIDQLIASSGSSKIDIIAHSQGGLLIKKLLLDHPEYQTKINKLVFVGTPNLGSPKSLKVLIYGDDFGIKKYGLGLDPLEIKKISQNMPSVYQMLPSREYFNHSSGYLGQYTFNLDSKSGKILPTFDETKNILKTPFYNLNSSLVDSADTFHSSAFDNFDFSNTGIKTFNIMGCKSATIGKMFINGTGGKDDITYEPGDGTVPLISASNINGAQNFYVTKTGDIHRTMLTTDGVRQKIVNIIADTNIPTSGLITSNPALCVFKGKKVEVHSPVDLNIYDENNNHVGPNPDGSFDYQIEGVQYDEIGHNKYAFLPDDGHIYTLKLNATGMGSFNFYSSSVNGSQTDNIAYYSDVLIASSSTAQVILNSDNNQTIDFTSDSRTIAPSSILDANQSLDPISPISTSTITGSLTSPGVYTGSVSISLLATDPVIVGKENQTSAVLKTQYGLDGGGYQTYSTTSPVSVSSEGQHSITFFSTDRAGNNEPEQTVSFAIIKQVVSSGDGGGGGGPSQFNTPFYFITTPTTAGRVLGTSTTASIVNPLISQLPPQPQLRHKEGSLIVDARGTVYLVQKQLLRPFTSAKRFLFLKFKFKNVSPMLEGDSGYFLGMPM